LLPRFAFNIEGYQWDAIIHILTFAAITIPLDFLYPLYPPLITGSDDLFFADFALSQFS
jgi:hypothetical protein